MDQHSHEQNRNHARDRSEPVRTLADTNSLLDSAQSLMDSLKQKLDSVADPSTRPVHEAKFAADPYVNRERNQQPTNPVNNPRSVAEILQSISGYRESQQHHQPTPVRLNTTNINSKPENLRLREGMRPTGNSEPTNPLAHSAPDEASTAARHLTTDPAPGNFEFDVLNFQDTESKTMLHDKPDSIPNAFEVDADFFETVAAELQSRDYRHSQQGRGAVVTYSETGEAKHEPKPPAGCFWAADGDTVYVDGKEGYSHIDLACFDVSSATFQSNLIQIQCDDGTMFEVDYRNVPYAVFADGVQVELAANELDFKIANNLR